jgi:uncharacterized protein (DUF1501 family)
MDRRAFLRNTSLASTAALVPNFVRAFRPGRLFNSRSEKILIVVQLSGGNDGLNTVIPYQNDLYYQLRPRLAIEAAEVLKLEDGLGLNPSMSALRELYDQGYVSILNNVGYPNPDRSHFRSMDIWHTASDSDSYLSTGWIGRYLDHQCTGCEAPHHVIELDDSTSLALKGETRSGFAMNDPRQLKKTTDNPFLKAVTRHPPDNSNENLDFLYKTLIDTQSSADYLFKQSRVARSSTQYPAGPFGKSLKQISELLTADTDTRIYYTSLGGFDTHVNQRNKQDSLLKQYAEGMKALVTDLKQNGLLNDVLILTFSEFGRRVKQNASNGTDHGTANNVFVIGGGLNQPGIHNTGPNLSDLDQGDLKYQIDFRQLYATVLEDWLNADATAVLGRKFKKVGII